MTLYELVFILLFLGSLIGVFLAAFVLRKNSSRRVWTGLAAVWGVYLAILAISDVLGSQKIFKVGEEECFDEMCFAVVDAETMPAQTFDSSAGEASAFDGGTLYVIKIRVSSHSRGRAQAEGGVRGRLYDNKAECTYIDVSERAQKAYDARNGRSPRLADRIAPGESVVSALVFEAPLGIVHPALTLDHGFTPGYLVIGESPFFHKPDIHLLLHKGD